MSKRRPALPMTREKMRGKTVWECSKCGRQIQLPKKPGPCIECKTIKYWFQARRV